MLYALEKKEYGCYTKNKKRGVKIMNISNKYHIPAKELDFVNINLSKDNRLFIDPLRIKNGNTEIHKKCYCQIKRFIDIIIKPSEERKYQELLVYIPNLHQRNETKLGYSLETKYGKSMGEDDGTALVQLLKKDDIFGSGFVEDIFDFLMIIPNVGEDKVSDLITTIIFKELIQYTQKQCKMWKIQTKKVKLKKLCWNGETESWENMSEELPMHVNKPIVFIPKSFVGKAYIFSYERMYRELIIPLYKDIELNKEISGYTVQYKNGRKHVLGNKLRQEYTCTKYVITDFVKKYDLLYREYKAKILNEKI